jgi:M6 family metalloprotease-like protein
MCTRRTLPRLCLAITLSTAACVAVPEQATPDVGQRVQAVHGATGSVPLLLLLVDTSASAQLGHNDAYYRQRIFGPGYPNVADYYREISNRSMTFVEAAVVHTQSPTSAQLAGVESRAQVPASEMDPAQRARYVALQHAEDGGFDFSQFDANGDGVVNTSELAVLQIDPVTPTSGQTGALGCTQHSGVQVCGAVSLTGDHGELMLYAHELMHQVIDAVDVYGATNWLDTSLSTMANTSAVDANSVYYPDPVHRSFAGWESRFLPILAHGGGSARLSAVADPSDQGTRGIVVSNPNSTLSEYLFIEYRRRLLNSYDHDVPQTGVYVWYARLNEANTQLDRVPSIDVAGAEEWALFLLAPQACVGSAGTVGSRGGVAPLAIGGSYRFRWLDGTDTGLLFSVSGDPGNWSYRDVSWEANPVAPSCP